MHSQCDELGMERCRVGKFSVLLEQFLYLNLQIYFFLNNALFLIKKEKCRHNDQQG